jgi:hypothetical protein
VEVYDTALDSWLTAADMGQERFGAGAASLDGKIYVFGGEDPDFSLLSSVEVYTPE